MGMTYHIHGSLCYFFFVVSQDTFANIILLLFQKRWSTVLSHYRYLHVPLPVLFAGFTPFFLAAFPVGFLVNFFCPWAITSSSTFPAVISKAPATRQTHQDETWPVLLWTNLTLTSGSWRRRRTSRAARAAATASTLPWQPAKIMLVCVRTSPKAEPVGLDSTVRWSTTCTVQCGCVEKRKNGLTVHEASTKGKFLSIEQISSSVRWLSKSR